MPEAKTITLLNHNLEVKTPQVKVILKGLAEFAGGTNIPVPLDEFAKFLETYEPFKSRQDPFRVVVYYKSMLTDTGACAFEGFREITREPKDSSKSGVDSEVAADTAVAKPPKARTMRDASSGTRRRHHKVEHGAEDEGGEDGEGGEEAAA